MSEMVIVTLALIALIAVIVVLEMLRGGPTCGQCPCSSDGSTWKTTYGEPGLSIEQVCVVLEDFLPPEDIASCRKRLQDVIVNNYDV
jgi:hypothetical protein